MIRSDRYGSGSDAGTRNRRPFYRQLGIVHGAVRRCGDPDFPGIYGRVGDEDNLDFILSSIGKRTRNRAAGNNKNLNTPSVANTNQNFNAPSSTSFSLSGAAEPFKIGMDLEKQPHDFTSLTYLNQILWVGGSNGIRRNNAKLMKMGQNGLETCRTLPNYPYFVQAAEAQVLDDGDRVVVCGGSHLANKALGKCFQMDLRARRLEWRETGSMTQKRHLARSTLTPDGRMWMTGGSTDEVGGTKTTSQISSTEILIGNEWRTGPELPAPVDQHCVQRLNDEEYILIGGHERRTDESSIIAQYYPTFVSKHTRIYNWRTKQWRNAPDMNTERRGHYCFKA